MKAGRVTKATKATSRGFRACQNCRKAKVRCIQGDGSRCRNCAARGLVCVGIEEERPTRGADKIPRKTSRIVKARMARGETVDLDNSGVSNAPNTLSPTQATAPRRSGRKNAMGMGMGASTNSTHGTFPTLVSPDSPHSPRSRSSSPDSAGYSPSPEGERVEKTRQKTGQTTEQQMLTTKQTQHNSTHASRILQHPSSSYQQATYWDMLISERMREANLDRTCSVRLIAADVWRVFSKSDFIATLFHLPSFYDALTLTRKRAALEPALVYALLAISYAFHGSTDKADARILKLKSEAYADTSHRLLLSAVNTSTYTLGVVQAAVCLHYYEFLLKPNFNIGRLGQAILIADSVIHRLALTTIDAHQVAYVYDDDGVSVKTSDDSAVGAESVESVQAQVRAQPAQSQPHPDTPYSIADGDSDSETSSMALYRQETPDMDAALRQPQASAHTNTHSTCPCNHFRESAHTTHKREDGITFRVVPRFNMADADEGEVMAEEVRRAVFGALNQGWNQMNFHPTPSLHISDSRNYGIYLSAERWVSRLPDPGMRSWSRRTITALLERMKLLCLGAIHLRSTPIDFHLRAAKIIDECTLLEKEVDKHTCTRGLPFWHILNIGFMIRLILTAKLRHLLNNNNRATLTRYSYFTRQQARQWLISHAEIYKQCIGEGIRDAPMIFGVLSVQALRCLDLYELDKDLVSALKVAKGVLAAMEQVLYYHPSSSADVKMLVSHIQRYNFEEECIKRAGTPDSPPPRPPSVQELTRYLDTVAREVHGERTHIH